MKIVDVEYTSATVILVPLKVDGEDWTARVKVLGADEKQVMEVIHAMGPDDQVKGRDEWDTFLTKHEIAESFWAEAVFQFVTRLSGGSDRIGIA